MHSLAQFLDGLQFVLAGQLRACGRQSLGARINFIGSELIGLPCCILFAFTAGLGVYGLWIGIILAVGVQASDAVLQH